VRASEGTPLGGGKRTQITGSELGKAMSQKIDFFSHDNEKRKRAPYKGSLFMMGGREAKRCEKNGRMLDLTVRIQHGWVSTKKDVEGGAIIWLSKGINIKRGGTPFKGKRIEFADRAGLTAFPLRKGALETRGKTNSLRGEATRGSTLGGKGK